MSMAHPEPPSSTIHGELTGKIISPPLPPMPPMPPPGAGIEILRETVEVQARTIRYLLSNYEALLRKVERGEDEDKLVVKYSLGADQNFAANTSIPAGWWVVVTAGLHLITYTHGGSTHVVNFNQGETLFSDGTAEKTAGPITLAPIETEIVKEEES